MGSFVTRAPGALGRSVGRPPSRWTHSKRAPSCSPAPSPEPLRAGGTPQLRATCLGEDPLTAGFTWGTAHNSGLSPVAGDCNSTKMALAKIYLLLCGACAPLQLHSPEWPARRGWRWAVHTTTCSQQQARPVGPTMATLGAVADMAEIFSQQPGLSPSGLCFWVDFLKSLFFSCSRHRCLTLLC